MTLRSDRGSAPTITTPEVLMELHRYHDTYGCWPTQAALMAEFGHKESQISEKIRWLLQSGDIERVGSTLRPLGLPPAGPVTVEHWTQEQIETHFASGGDRRCRRLQP